MSKVLISFLGTAQPKERQYRKACYRFENGDEYECAFIAQALIQYYKVDKIILIGTVKSMWEEVYHTFSNPTDENVYFDLYEHCINANALTELRLPHQELLEASLGKDSKAILIKYGLNEKEIQYNQATILQLEKHLRHGDQLYIDITHSFRSLPLFLMNTLIYLQNVSLKNISIEHISYGMLDATQELGYTPVIELNSIMHVNEWISGAYSFIEFGNAYKIAHLLDKKYKSISQRLIKFSDIKNLNHLNAIEKQIQELQGLRLNDLPEIAQLVVTPVIKEFLTHFKNWNSHADFQYRLAQWYFEKHNYSSAYLVFVEAIISHVCEIKKYDVKNKKQREIAKDDLFGDPQFSSLQQIFNQVNDIRKQIAHSIKSDKNTSDMIQILKKNLITFHQFLKS